MFTDFILKRMTPCSSKDKMEILLFDEHLSKKNNRMLFSTKRQTPIIDSKSYDYKSVFQVVNCAGLTDKEKSLIIKDNQYD